MAKRVVGGAARYSLSCNTDTTLDILRARAEGRVPALAGTTRGEICAPYLFLFTGLRLAMNAAMPSDRSSSAKVE